MESVWVCRAARKINTGVTITQPSDCGRERTNREMHLTPLTQMATHRSASLIPREGLASH